MVIDLFYWFDKSPKRKASLADFYSFCDVEYRKIVKNVNTRWLSLERAVGCMLQQYIGLKSYFLSNNENKSRFHKLCSLFKDPMTDIYLLFYQSVLQQFINFNVFLQREDPIIPVVDEQTTSFLQWLGTKFLKFADIRHANRDFSSINFKEMELQHPDNALFIGCGTKIQL